MEQLADASEEEVLRIWQGLGYYSRARNLHATARQVKSEFGGKFPSSYNELIKLKGIGPYTAAAISSICFNEPRPVVDGNVFRFASRFFGVEDDISKPGTRKIFEDLLGVHIPHKNPGIFNQAMMEFGSKVCSPSPNCGSCVFSAECVALAKGQQNSLPVKSGKTKVRERTFNYLVLYDGENYLMKQREKGDVWAHLYDFPMFEGKLSEEDVLTKTKNETGFDFTIEEISSPTQHILSHQRINAIFFKLRVHSINLKPDSNALGRFYSVEEIVTLPKPKLIVKYLMSLGIKS